MEIVRNVPVFAVIGDSAAYGTGDEIKPGEFRGWAKILADNFRNKCDYINYSRPGAKSTEISSIQLEKIKHHHPDLCAVIAGGNDLLRNNFDPELLYLNLQSTCKQLISIGSEILMLQLHDPNKLLKLPRLLARVLRRRVNAVNEVYDRIASEFDVVLVQTRSIPNVHDLKYWHIDRMHPGPMGHFLLARKFSELLRTRGWDIQLPHNFESPKKAKLENIKWYLRNAFPWFLKRSIDLLPAAIYLMSVEAINCAVERFKNKEQFEIVDLVKKRGQATNQILKAS